MQANECLGPEDPDKQGKIRKRIKRRNVNMVLNVHRNHKAY